LFLIFEVALFPLHELPATRPETDGIGYMLRSVGPLFQIADFHGPGYSWAIRVAVFLGLDLFSAAKLVSIVSALLFLVFAWLLMIPWNGPRAASIALFLLAPAPAVFLGGASILSDMLAAACFLACFAVLSAPSRVTATHFALSGAVAALAYLTRSIYATALVIPIVFLLLKTYSDDLNVNLRRLTAYAGAFAAITTPWLVFVYREKGSPFWSLNHLNLAFRMYRRGQGWNAFPVEEAFAGAWDVLRADPVRFLTMWMDEIIRAPSRVLHLIPPLALVAAIGCLIWFLRFNRAKLAYVLAVTPYLLAVSLVWHEDRYYLILAPLAASFIAEFITETSGAIAPLKIPAPLRPFSGRTVLHTAFIVVAVLLCAPQTFRRVRELLADQAPEYRAAARWIATHGVPSPSVLAAKPHVAFYCGARDIRFRDVRLQDVEVPELSGILKRSRPTYFVFDERYAAAEFPNLRSLLDQRQTPLPGILTPVFVTESPRKVVVYEVAAQLAARAPPNE